MDFAAKCGNYNIDPQSLKNDIARAAEAMGMSQQCARDVENTNQSDHFEFHMNYQADVGWGAASVSGGLGLSQSSSDTRNYLSESGCGTALADLKNIIDEKYKIACDMNNTSVSTTQTVNGSQSILIDASITDEQAKTLANKRLELEKQRPVRPSPPTLSELSLVSQDVSRMAFRLYGEAVKVYEKELEAFNKRVQMWSNPDILASGAIIKNKGLFELKIVTEISQETRQRIVESVKNIAGTVATTNVALESGLGSSSSGVSSMVSSNIENRTSDITESINQVADSLEINVNSNQQIVISSVAGKIDIRGTEITNDLTINLLTERFTEVAFDIGKEISSEIIKEAASTTDFSQDLGGFEDVLKEVNEGLAARLRSLQDAQTGWVQAAKGNSWMYMLLGLMLFGGMSKAGVGKKSFMKIIMLLLLLYVVLALLFGWFPFNLFDIKLLDFGDSDDSSESDNSREELKLERKDSSKKFYNNKVNISRNQSSIQQITRREHRKKHPYTRKEFLNFTGMAIRGREEE